MLRANPIVDLAAFRSIRLHLVGQGWSIADAEAEAKRRMEIARNYVRHVVTRAGDTGATPAEQARTIADAMDAARDVAGVDLLTPRPR